MVQGIYILATVNQMKMELDIKKYKCPGCKNKKESN